MRLLRQNKKGSALISALVVLVVLMVLCLSMLLVSFSLYNTVNAGFAQSQCRELAKTLSIALEKEITEPVYAGADAFIEGADSSENQLWYYLRYNLYQSGWTYYNKDEPGHVGNAYRTLALDAATTEQLKDATVKVEVYYSGEAGNYTPYSDYPMYVRVTCEKDGQQSIVTSQYSLGATEGSQGGGGTITVTAEQKERIDAICTSYNATRIGSICTPTGTGTEYTMEDWQWSLDSRE